MILVPCVVLANTAIRPWNQRLVSCVLPVGILKEVAPNAKPVKLEEQRTAMSLVIRAKIVTQANIGPAV